MTSRTLALDNALHRYLLDICLNEHPLLQELREFTSRHRMAKMQIAPEQGQFMAWLAHLIGARRYLEIGVFTGYSTLAVALAMPEDSEILACDLSEEFTEIARRYWQKAGVDERIRLVLQPARTTLRQEILSERCNYYDLAFIDADKSSYHDYFEACLQLVRPGGVIVIDNIFLSGRTAEPHPEDPPGVHRLHEFNARLKHDKRIRLSILPLGDGVALCTRVQ
ncbi:class I SAM-dependent methyltransferase [Neisseriaceae bacterium TC5R-5]|nr:class I SAM-dependent methyltransferase [Neisseriaceae bacterium TC5R-5]